MVSQREAEGAQVWRGLYGSELAEAMRAQVKKTQRLHDAGDPAGEYGQVWAAGGGFPVSLTRADPGTEWKARDAAKAARQVWDRKNPQLDLDGFRKARN